LLIRQSLSVQYFKEVLGFVLQRRLPKKVILSYLLFLIIWPALACSPTFLARSEPTATPTKTPKTVEVGQVVATETPLPPPVTPTPAPTETPTNTPIPADTPTPLPTDTPLPTETPTETTEIPPTATPLPPTETPPPAPPTATPEPTAPPTPALDFVITELRALGLGENNGGIEGAGSGRTIFITVIDAAGNPIDGALIVNTAEYPRQTISGDKGAGKAEVLMDREVFRLKIESVGGAPVRSETSHNMSLMQPVPQDIVGKLGGPDYSNPSCITLDNCPLPPGKHFSYVITFQRTY
jgi:hypothetical protein